MGLLGVIFSVVKTILYWVLVKPMAWISTTRFRFLVLIPIVLPMSLLYYWFTTLRLRIFFALNSGPKNHPRKVEAVIASIKGNASSASPKKMCTARPAWENMSIFHAQYKSHMHQVDLSKFIDILEIDEKKQTVRVEPLVNVGMLTQALVPLGWTIQVLPELDDLTVGGLVNGFGIESSSHKYGLFQHIVASLDVVLPDGTFVHCSPDEHAELFYNLPWSHGTLGFLVAAEIKMVKAQQLVRLQYQAFKSVDAFMAAMREVTAKGAPNEFVEALQYSASEFVLMTGNFATRAGADGLYFDHGAWHAPWFFEHVREYLHKGKGVEYIPLRAYYHRHTRSLFWEMEDLVPFGNHWLFRVLMGWMLPLKVGFVKLTTPAELHVVYVEKHVDQDVLVPLKALPQCLQRVHAEFAMYPLWLCPCRIPATPVRGLVNPHDAADDMYVDVGVYGVPPAARLANGGFRPAPALRRFEQFVRDVHGFQALYAITYQTRDEFYTMFDHSPWQKLRSKYKVDAFLPSIYDKVSLRARGEADQEQERDRLVLQGSAAGSEKKVL